LEISSSEHHLFGGRDLILNAIPAASNRKIFAAWVHTHAPSSNPTQTILNATAANLRLRARGAQCHIPTHAPSPSIDIIRRLPIESFNAEGIAGAELSDDSFCKP
jgi:hypothetical protein